MKRLCFGALLLVLSGCSSNTLKTEPAPAVPLVGDALCMAGVAGYGTMTDLPAMQAQIAVFQALKIKTIRYDLTWSNVETTKGVYDLDWLETPLEELEAAGIQSIPILDYGNTLYNPEGVDYPPPPQAYAAFAAAVATRFGTRFLAYEIWNEENAGYRFWMPEENPAAYAALLSAANTSIKAACAACKVISGGVYWPPELVTGGVPFLQATFAALPALRTAVDGIGVHPYEYYPPSTPPDSTTPPEVPLVQMMTEAIAAPAATPALPAWITEVGWPTYPGLVSDDSQAAYLMMTYALSSTVGARSICWFTLQDGAGFASFPPEAAFGIIDYADGGPPTAGTPKPAYQAMQMVSQWLGSTGFSRNRGTELGLTETGEAALFFRNPAATLGVTVLWNENADPGATVRLALHGSVSVKVLDAIGETLSYSSASGKVSVPMGPMPTLVIESAE